MLWRTCRRRFRSSCWVRPANRVFLGQAGSDHGPVTLLEGGAYTLEIDATGEQTSDYVFRLLQVAAAPAVTAGATTRVQLAPRRETKVLRFSGTAGQRVRLDPLTSASLDAEWRFVGPDNRNVIAPVRIDRVLSETVLSMDGTYLVVIAGTSPGPTPMLFDFSLTAVTDAPVAVSGLGDEKNGSIAPGTTATYTFDAPAGHPVFFDGMNSGSSILVELADPTGATVMSSSARDDAGPFVIPRSGTYNVTVRGTSASASGNYQFRFLDLAVAPVLSLNTELTGNLGIRESAVYRFSGSTGQRLFYDARDSDNDNVRSRLTALSPLAVFESNADSDQGPLSLGVSGPHYLVIESRLTGVGDYAFALWDVGTQPELTLDTTVTATVDPGRSVVLFRLTGTAGRRWFFDTAVSSAQADWYLYDPANAQVLNAASTLTRDLEVTLTADGTHTLLLSGRSANPVPYSFRVVAPDAPAVALSLDTETAGTISEPGEQRHYTFDGTAGQRLFYDAMDADNDSISVRLINPSGRIEWGPVSSEQDRGVFTLGLSGAYRLEFDGNGDAIGAYRFQLIDVDAQPEATLDTLQFGTLTQGRSAAILRVVGTAGQPLFFDSSIDNVPADWTLFEPGDAKVPNGETALSRDLEVTLPTDGTYALLLSGRSANPVSYAFRIVTFETPETALTLDTEVAAALLEPGERRIYTFTGVAGQRLFYDALDADNEQILASLVSPSGTVLFSGNAENDRGPFSLLETGAYAWVIDGSGDVTGSFRFTVIDVATQPTVPLDALQTGFLNPGRSVRLLRLPGLAGQRLFFDTAVANVPADWYVYEPGNAQLPGGAQALRADLEVELPVDGDYILLLSGRSANPVSYAFTIVTPDRPEQALALDVPTSGTLAEPGEQHYHTFDGAVGQRLYYDARDDQGESMRARLRSPSGETLFDISAETDRGPFTLTQSGPYVLELDGVGDVVGTYDFTVLDLANAPVHTVGAVINSTLQPRLETDFFQFNGVAGQRLNLTSLGSSGTQADWRLFSPADDMLAQNSIQANLGAVTLPLAGPYLVQVSGRSGGASALTYQLQSAVINDVPVPASGLGLLQSGTLAAGTTQQFTFTAPAGLWIYFDGQEGGAGNVWADLDTPDATRLFQTPAQNDNGPHVLPMSGTYTLTVRGSNPSAAGTFRFRILDLVNGIPNLALDTATSDVFSQGRQSDIYRFTANAGQRLYYDGLEGDQDRTLVTLIEPDRGTLFVNGNADTDRGPLTVRHSGVHYLVVFTDRDELNDYVFRMMDVATQPTLTLDAPVIGSLDPGWSAAIYRHTAAAGERLFFDSQTSGSGASWGLYNGHNAAVGSVPGINADLDRTLADPGEHLLVVQGTSANLLTYLFQVVTYGIGTQALTLGERITSELSEPGEQDVYTFTATAGQRIYYDALEADFDRVLVTLLGPDGRDVFSFVNADNDRGPLTLPIAGVYQLVVFSDRDLAANYDFRIIDIGAEPPLTLDVPVNGALNPGYGTTVFRYRGTAGQALFFDSQTGGSGANWGLYNGHNTALGPVPGINADFDRVLGDTSEHLLVIKGDSANIVPYFFQVVTYEVVSAPLAFGQRITQQLGEPGERDCYTFTAQAGQRIYYDALDGDLDRIFVSLRDPAGRDVFHYVNSDRDQGPLVLSWTGVYELEVWSDTDAVGDYDFRLIDIAVQPELPLDSVVSAALDPGRSVALYRHAGLRGQRLFFDALSSSSSANWEWFTPDLGKLVDVNIRQDFQSNLEAAGKHLLLFNGDAGSPLLYSFQVVTANDETDVSFNRGPELMPIGNWEIGENTELTFQVVATDQDPGDTLTYSLDAPVPSGATVDPVTGRFRWTPPVTGFSRLEPIIVRVRDNGVPPLSTVEVIEVIVIAGPVMITVEPDAGMATVRWRSAVGERYQLQYRNQIDDPDWTDLGGEIVADDFETSFLDDTVGDRTQRFYRVILLD